MMCSLKSCLGRNKRKERRKEKSREGGKGGEGEGRKRRKEERKDEFVNLGLTLDSQQREECESGGMMWVLLV